MRGSLRFWYDLSMKKCTKCGEEKGFEGFYKASSRTDGLQSSCKECNKAYKKAWYEKNKERAQEQRRKYRAENAEKYKAQRKRYYNNNKEKCLQATREWRLLNKEQEMKAARSYIEANREHILKTKRFYRALNAEQIRQYQLEWRRKNKDKVAARNSSRRALKAANGRCEVILPSIVWSRDKGICGICGESAVESDWHLDHIVPLSKGGPHIYENIQVSHPQCNLRKGTKMLAANVMRNLKDGQDTAASA